MNVCSNGDDAEENVVHRKSSLEELAEVTKVLGYTIEKLIYLIVVKHFMRGSVCVYEHASRL